MMMLLKVFFFSNLDDELALEGVVKDRSNMSTNMKIKEMLPYFIKEKGANIFDTSMEKLKNNMSTYCRVNDLVFDDITFTIIDGIPFGITDCCAYYNRLNTMSISVIEISKLKAIANKIIEKDKLDIF